MEERGLDRVYVFCVCVRWSGGGFWLKKTKQNYQLSECLFPQTSQNDPWSTTGCCKRPLICITRGQTVIQHCTLTNFTTKVSRTEPEIPLFHPIKSCELQYWSYQWMHCQRPVTEFEAQHNRGSFFFPPICLPLDAKDETMLVSHRKVWVGRRSHQSLIVISYTWLVKATNKMIYAAVFQ